RRLRTRVSRVCRSVCQLVRMVESPARAETRPTTLEKGTTPVMRFKFVSAVALMALLALGVGAAPISAGQAERRSVEPGAVNWHTWILGSPGEVRPGVPPDAAGTASELDELRAVAAQRDAAALDQIA